jgi:hypothetical protein
MRQNQPDALVRRKGDYGRYGGNGTLPETWIPPAELRDLRNLMHSRLALANNQTCLKNRYAGLVPVVHASGGHTFYGPNSRRSNLYLRSAFVEATNLAAIRRKQHPERHVSQLYERLRQAKGHQKAPWLWPGISPNRLGGFEKNNRIIVSRSRLEPAVSSSQQRVSAQNSGLGREAVLVTAKPVTKKLLLSKKRIDDSRNEAATEEPIGAFRREAYDS